LSHHKTIYTPAGIRGTVVVDSIGPIVNSLDDTNDDDDESNCKRHKYLKITPKHLTQIITAYNPKVLA